MRWRALGQFALLVALLVVLAAGLLYPIWLTVRGGFEGADGGFTLHHIRTIFADPVLRESLVNSFLIACVTTLLATLIALPLATVAAKFDYPFKRTLGALILVPMILPPFVGAIGLHHLLGRAGAINTLLMNLGLIDHSGGGIDFIGRGGFWAVCVIQALALYPIIYLNATAALANLDPALEEAAENLGAGWWRRYVRIVLPLIRPGLFAGATIVFIWAFTELGTPLMFEYNRVAPVQIFNGLKEMETSRTPYALTAVMLLGAVVFYVTGKFIFGGRAYAMYSKAAIGASTSPLRGWRGWAAAGLFFAVIAIAILPHISVVLVSLGVEGTWYHSIVPQRFTLEHYESALSHPLAVGSIRNSLFYATMAVLLDLVLGIMIGYLVVRTRLPGRNVLDALAMLPLAVPGLVMAFGYVAMTLRWPFQPMLDASGNEIAPALLGWINVIGATPNPVPLLIMAFAVRRLPYIVRAVVAGLEQTSVELEEAAMNLGATRIMTVRRIVLPLIAANLIAGALLTFSFAMLEVSDSLILAQREQHYPITKAIYVLFERLGDGQQIASAMGVWAMALLGVTLVGCSLLIGKKMGAIFRV